MVSKLDECIELFVNSNYRGQLIGISEVANFCDQSKGEVLIAIEKLNKLGKIEIITRFFCPMTHSIAPDEYPLCSECNYNYPASMISVIIYIRPVIN
jgi:hypothetical protein